VSVFVIEDIYRPRKPFS